MGTHVIKLSATDLFAGKWVGGQVSVNVTPADGGTTITLASITGRAASASGHLRLRFQAVGLSLPPSLVQVFLSPTRTCSTPSRPPPTARWT